MTIRITIEITENAGRVNVEIRERIVAETDKARLSKEGAQQMREMFGLKRRPQA